LGGAYAIGKVSSHKIFSSHNTLQIDICARNGVAMVHVWQNAFKTYDIYFCNTEGACVSCTYAVCGILSRAPLFLSRLLNDNTVYISINYGLRSRRRGFPIIRDIKVPVPPAQLQTSNQSCTARQKNHQTSIPKKQLSCIYNMYGVIVQMQRSYCVISVRKDI